MSIFRANFKFTGLSSTNSILFILFAFPGNASSFSTQAYDYRVPSHQSSFSVIQHELYTHSPKSHPEKVGTSHHLILFFTEINRHRS
jgi:hypothetical protein